MKRLIISGTLLSALGLGVSAFAGPPRSVRANNQNITISDTIPGQRMDSTMHHQIYNPTDTSMRRDSIRLVR